VTAGADLVGNADLTKGGLLQKELDDEGLDPSGLSWAGAAHPKTPKPKNAPGRPGATWSNVYAAT
jgi:hypothetical protein